MQIGIVVYSHTGNTLGVAERLEERLAQAGHRPVLTRLLVPEGYQPAGGKPEILNPPDLSGCEALVVASPVNAFSLSAVMSKYLAEVEGLGDRGVAALVTQFFPFPWMGGNRTLRQIRRACEGKGARYLGGAVVNWGTSNREARIECAVDQLARMFEA